MKKIPMRKCLGCMESKPKRELLRIVKDKENNIYIDESGKKQGRGAYICKCDDCLIKLRKTKRLNKEFECEIPEKAYDDISVLLDKHMLEG